MNFRWPTSAGSSSIQSGWSRSIAAPRRQIPNGEIWAPNPDLSKVEEIGFADLMPGSGHGTGGWIQLATIEVYGKTVPQPLDRSN